MSFPKDKTITLIWSKITPSPSHAHPCACSCDPPACRPSWIPSRTSLLLCPPSTRKSVSSRAVPPSCSSVCARVQCVCATRPWSACACRTRSTRTDVRRPVPKWAKYRRPVMKWEWQRTHGDSKHGFGHFIRLRPFVFEFLFFFWFQ